MFILRGMRNISGKVSELHPRAHEVGTWVTSFGAVGIGIIGAYMNGYGSNDKSATENIGVPAAYAFVGTVGLQLAMQLFLASGKKKKPMASQGGSHSRNGSPGDPQPVTTPLSRSLYNTVSSAAANAFLIAFYFAGVQASLKWSFSEDAVSWMNASNRSNELWATAGVVSGDVLLSLWSKGISLCKGSEHSGKDYFLDHTVPLFAAALIATFVAHVAPLDEAGAWLALTSVTFGVVFDAVRYATDKRNTVPKLQWKTAETTLEEGAGVVPRRPVFRASPTGVGLT